MKLLYIRVYIKKVNLLCGRFACFELDEIHGEQNCTKTLRGHEQH